LLDEIQKVLSFAFKLFCVLIIQPL